MFVLACLKGNCGLPVWILRVVGGVEDRRVAGGRLECRGTNCGNSDVSWRVFDLPVYRTSGRDTWEISSDRNLIWNHTGAKTGGQFEFSDGELSAQHSTVKRLSLSGSVGS